jgi:protease I
MTDRLKGRTIAFLATDGVEQVELTEPWQAVEQAGGTPVLVAPKGGEIQAFEHLDKGKRFPVQRELASASADDFDGLVLPGGVANPDALRTDERAVSFVRDFFEADKPVAAICHAAWLLVEAGVAKGRTMTSWPSLRTDVENAGGTWVDREVQVEQKLVTSRKPDDLAAFTRALVEEFAGAMESDSVDAMSEQSFPASDPPPPPSRAGSQPARPPLRDEEARPGR